MSLRRTELHARLSADERAWALMTGIACGWEPTVRGVSAYVVGCEECGFHVRHAVADELLDAARFDLRADVEREQQRAFAAEADAHGCPHWYKYKRYKGDYWCRKAVLVFGGQAALHEDGAPQEEIRAGMAALGVREHSGYHLTPGCRTRKPVGDEEVQDGE